MKYTICTIIKNEQRYLEEWLNHCFNIGFTDIHLYEDYGSISHKEICDKFTNVYLHSYDEVEITDYSARDKKQIDLFNHFVKQYKEVYDWCAFIDPDEFIYFEEGWNIENFCKEFYDLNGVMIQQKTFGCNGHIKRPEGGLEENYNNNPQEYKKPRWNMKTFVNFNKGNIEFKDVHRVRGSLFTNRKGKLEQAVCYDKAWYNHYYTKSWEDWVERFTVRGDVCPGNVKINEFFVYNKIKVNDLVGFEKMFKGLNLGCGNNCLVGWLNTDLEPIETALYLDVTKKLPFNDNSFKYILCEHVFEHLTITDGLELLKEAHRVLEPNGIFRIALPTKDKLDKIYNDEEGNKKYIDFHFKHYDKNSPIKNACIALNNFYRMWGHKTIYDKKTLEELFNLGGFRKIKEYNVNESDDIVLKNIEAHDNEIGEFNVVETEVFELQKDEEIIDNR